MATFIIKGHTTVDVEIEIEAETLEEAIEIADDNITMEAYANGTVGVDMGSDDRIANVDCDANGWLEWDEEYCEEI